MARILVLTTDLPYFPGKLGGDFFSLRFLATRHEVAVVGPLYDSTPAEGLANLERSVGVVLAWPRPVAGVSLFVQEDAPESLRRWVDRLPARPRRWILHRLLGIHPAPADAFEKLAILSNCAPHLLKALEQGSCQGYILVQSNLVPWLDYLPGPGARFFYFHDVRSDYLSRMKAGVGAALSAAEVAAIRLQERTACHRADGAGFVSELDLQRAQRLLEPACTTGVVPIPLDTGYFTPAPADWVARPEPVVLFTGHLSHPPNVDAVKYFIAEIWPAVLQAVPTAVFVAAGMMPSPELILLSKTARNFELHPNVPDIRPYFWNARVYVVPMRFGGGVRQKIFEAWSMRIPVVCTTMATEGIEVKSGQTCWLEDTPAAFAARIIALIQSGAPAPVVSAAKLKVQVTNSIPAAAPRFARLVEETIAGRAKRPFRLLCDLRWMKIGAAGGAEQMAHEALAALAHLDRRNHYRLYCPRSTFHEWDFPREFNARGIFSDEQEKLSRRLGAAIGNRLAEGLGLPPILTPPMRTLGALQRMDFDLVHSMIGYIHPDLAAFPNILSALDLQHLYHHDFFTPEEWKERDRLYRASVASARHIICISENTRQDLHRHYHVPLDKMTTIWIIPSRQMWRVLPDTTREALLDRMGVRAPFLFFPAHSWPHKNHARLLEAFALIRPELPANMTLVFTGRPFSADHPARQIIAKLGIDRDVLHLGYRSPLEMQALFHGCFMLVFPSLFEGFGMPVAEAMIAGKPVACSNRTSLPEIAGDAALTFDPTDVNEIGARILAIANDPKCYSDLAGASRRRRPLFSSRMSAIKTLAVYQRVYEELYS